ncbi:MAG TPA: zinc ribbon domain-containing protein [Acidobacteriaceae bacterium]|nr:zinc ribbon domain-containing protein [Acidobacteriaceae bacterium]
MPLYEYRCKNCGHQFEKIQSFSAPEEKECPVCQGPVEKLLSAPAIQFKGSGWYVNDYASKSSKSMKASAESGGKSSESGSSDSKSSDKPAASSDNSGSSSKPAPSAGKSE